MSQSGCLIIISGPHLLRWAQPWSLLTVKSLIKKCLCWRTTYFSTENNFQLFSLVKIKGFMTNQISVITEMAFCLMEAWDVALCKVNRLHNILFGTGLLFVLSGQKNMPCVLFVGNYISPFITNCQDLGKVNMLVFYKQNTFEWSSSPRGGYVPLCSLII